MTINRRSWKTVTAIVSCLSMGAAKVDGLPYPENYRYWVHIKSALVGPQSAFFESSAGLHHIYANDQAMAGYRTGTFPDGSVIVFDLLEVSDSAGNTVEGARRRIDVMAKDSRRFAATGGWGFERFLHDSKTDRAVAAVTTQCFACHEKRKTRDFVFSEFRQ